MATNRTKEAGSTGESAIVDLFDDINKILIVHAKLTSLASNLALN